MIPQETVNLILDTAQIVDVVSDYVTLKRRGASYVACCPFHNEKTPSFYVTPSKGIYKCFGCGKAGTAVGFVMEQEHCSYVEALRYLARKYNIEIVEEQESAEDIARRQRGESLLLVSDFARKFFTDQLKSGEGRAVGYAYFRSRGIEDETIARWSLGWAPSGRTALVDAARAAGYKDEYLLGAGLAVQNDDGTLSDKFRERVMFPIHSVSGRVIAFSGRTLRSDNPAKYVNSPETEIYVKSRNLLGIYLAKSAIAREDRCILVEGNVDVVMMHQLGITNVVASCGTSLTVEQVRLIKKFTENITI
ncbi:MAG: DNA primase, partial [Bacteroidales bacterium]|nr:DNA primase [Bacteroidales bacterium]